MSRAARAAAITLAFIAGPALAMGPNIVCGNSGVKWPSGLTLNYDPGTLGYRSKVQGDAVVSAAADLWSAVTTSSLRITRGPDLPYDATQGNYRGFVDNIPDGLNAVIYDGDGSIIDDFYGAGARFTTNVATAWTFYPDRCTFADGRIIVNGSAGGSDAEFTVRIAHELGHLIGLDHAQLDYVQGVDAYRQPLMYPRTGRWYTTLSDDDAASITALYPGASRDLVYGEVNGVLRAADGVTPVRGANVWAREITTGKLYSGISDYLAQGTGAFRLLLPHGTYSLTAESVRSGFIGPQAVGPHAATASSPSFQAPLYVSGSPMTPVTLGGTAPIRVGVARGCVTQVSFTLAGGGFATPGCIDNNADVTVESSVSPSTPDQTVTFTVRVVGSRGYPVGGTVAVFSDGVPIATCERLAVYSGVASCSTSSLAAGTHRITAQYTGDGLLYAPAATATWIAHLVTQAGTWFSLSLNNYYPTSNYNLQVGATLYGSSMQMSGTVDFHEGGTRVCSVPFSGGYYSYPFYCNVGTKAPGNYTYVVTYSGNAYYAPSTSSLTVTVTAPPPVALSVYKLGIGTGLVTTTPGGISCGAACTGTFTQGTGVNFHATPDEGMVFTGWGGACSGSQQTCYLAATYSTSVYATFAPASTVAVSLPNGGFETPTGMSARPTGWSGFGGGAITNPGLDYYGAPAAPEGVQALYLYSTTGGFGQYLYFAAGGDYRVRFQATVPTKWAGAPVKVRWRSVDQVAIRPAAGAWNWYSQRITVTTAGTYLLELVSDGSAGFVFIDNVSVVADAPAFVPGGSFETPVGMSNVPTGWEATSAGTITNAALAYYGRSAAPDGLQAAFIYNTTGSLSRLVPLAGGVYYDLTFRAAIPQNWTPSGVRVLVDGVSKNVTLAQADEWGWYRASFSVPSDCTCRITLATDGTSNGMAFIDYVSISQSIMPPAPSIGNGGFETPLGMSQMPLGWSGSGGTITNAGLAYYGAPPAPGGSQAAYIYNTSSGLRQTVSMNPGSVMLTLRATAPSTWTAARFKVRVDGVDYGTFTPATGSWSTHTVPLSFTTAADRVVEIDSDGTSNGMVFIDDVTISPP